MKRPCYRAVPGAHTAFTLIELVVVILILGILAAVAAPRLVATSSETSQQAFIRHLLVFYNAVERYYLDHQAFPPDSPTGVMPPELDPYLRATEFTKQTPIGGQWDYATTAYGLIAGVGVHFPGGAGFPGFTVMNEIDTLLDDGLIDKGSFQRKDSGARFYFILR